MTETVSFDKLDWRVRVTLERLASNIPAAVKVLDEEGFSNLAGQLTRDAENLAYWLEQGGLVAGDGDARIPKL